MARRGYTNNNIDHQQQQQQRQRTAAIQRRTRFADKCTIFDRNQRFERYTRLSLSNTEHQQRASFDFNHRRCHTFGSCLTSLIDQFARGLISIGADLSSDCIETDSVSIERRITSRYIASDS